jgi:hypothetical protein
MACDGPAEIATTPYSALGGMEAIVLFSREVPLVELTVVGPQLAPQSSAPTPDPAGPPHTTTPPDLSKAIEYPVPALTSFTFPNRFAGNASSLESFLPNPRTAPVFVKNHPAKRTAVGLGFIGIDGKTSENHRDYEILKPTNPGRFEEADLRKLQSPCTSRQQITSRDIM